MTALLRWAPWVVVAVALAVAAVAWGLMRGAQGQRDAARARQQAAELAADVHLSSARAAADAAEQLGRAIHENDERCGTALASAREDSQRLRGMLRACQTDEAIERRGAELFPARR